MQQFFDTLTDASGNSLLGATVTVKNYPSLTLATIYSANGTASPIAGSVVLADITGQVSFYAPDGAYSITYTYKGTDYKTRSPVQIGDVFAQVAILDTGAVNAYVVTDSRLPAQLYDGLKMELQPAVTNTLASTLNLNGTGAQPITLLDGTALYAGVLTAGGRYRLEWNGTKWLVVGPPTLNAAAVTAVLTATAIGTVLFPKTAAETAASVSPVFAYPVGSPLRASFYTNPGWFDFGDVATFISTTSFSFVGDLTARYTTQRRLQIRDSGGGAVLARIASSVFGAGLTTVTVVVDIGNVPNPVAGVFMAMSLLADDPGFVVWSTNYITFGPSFWNKSSGAAAASRITVFSGTSGTGADVGLAIIAIQNSYAALPYITGAPAVGRQIVIHTGVAAPITFGVHDVAKLTLTDGNNPTFVYSDLQVENDQAGAVSTKLIIDNNGGLPSRLSMRVSGAEIGFYNATATETTFGCNTAIDVSFVYNGSRVFTLNGVNATAAATATLTANKPGANAGVITWISVKSGAGTQGWIPIFGN